MNIGIPSRLSISAAPRDQLVDIALDCYIDWREQSAAAREAYETWFRAPAARLSLAFAAYEAALEQEEYTATAYAGAIEALELMLRERGHAERPVP